jgi:hypothetical protein
MKVIRWLIFGQFVVGIFLVWVTGIGPESQHTLLDASLHVFGAFIILDVVGIWVAHLLSKYLFYEDISFSEFLKDRW